MTILSEQTPLIFQWLPKKFGDAVPNNEDYPYLQRLVTWAESEPQRSIYLVINGAGLTKKKIEDLEDAVRPLSNIRVVDFHTINLGKLEKIKGFTIIELLKYRYPNHQDDRFAFCKEIPFGDVLDLMRLFMLQSRENFTGSQEAIYLDFDILPAKEGKKIGPVEMPGVVLMADGRKNTKSMAGSLENCIIAVNETSREVLSEIIAETTKIIDESIPSHLNGQTSFRVMQRVVNQYSPLKNYRFSGAVEITEDNSWMDWEYNKDIWAPRTLKNLYAKPNLPITFSNNSIKTDAHCSLATQDFASFAAGPEKIASATTFETKCNAVSSDVLNQCLAGS